MINVNIKSNKGITIITLIMAIIIMLVISSTLIYNVNNGAKVRALNNMYSDIQLLKDRIDLYYSSNGTLPILQTQYTNIDNIKEINSNDNDKYYVIDLEMLENITLNYGKAYNEFKSNSSINTLDVYIVNEQSHNIYYAKGVIVDNKTYYTIPGNYTKVIDNTAPTTPTIDILSGTKSKRGFYTGEVVLRVTPGIDKMSGVSKTTYKIIKNSVEQEETQLGEDLTITLKDYADYKIMAYTYDKNNNKASSNELSFTIKEEQLPTVPYEGVGYKFIYDGTLNSPGKTGANMCTDVTGGWTEKRTSFSHNNGASYIWYYGWLYTNSIIDLSEYSKLYINSEIYGNVNNDLYATVYGAQIQHLQNNILVDIMPNNIMDFYYKENGKTIGKVELPNNWKGYIGLYSCHSTVNTWSYNYENNYIRNFTVNGRSVDAYEIVAMKEDNWADWLEIAEIDSNEEQYDELEKVLNNIELLTELFNNKSANEYLLKCSGTLMIEILKTDTAYNTIPNELKNQMKNNANWSKFATICEREL